MHHCVCLHGDEAGFYEDNLHGLIAGASFRAKA